MSVSVIGLGYVGCVSIGCFADIGLTVEGVDIQDDKVKTVNRGEATVIEPQLDSLIKNGVVSGSITATSKMNESILKNNITIICVGTPLSAAGNLDLSAIFSVSKEIANVLKYKEAYHIIVIRSTVAPGTCDEIESLISDISNKKAGVHYDVVSNPEFLREGTAVSDFMNPPLQLIGSSNAHAAKVVANLYKKIDAPVEFTDRRSAEIMKYINNSFHALKVTFANEVGNICKRLNIDSHEVMRIFCKDRKLNISENYLQPGFAYGGSCLPKDTSALVKLAESVELQVPIISHIQKSNDYHIKVATNLVMKRVGVKKVGVLGISFKANTDDLRNSPILEVAKSLLENGKDVLLFDKSVNASLLRGQNAQILDNDYPFLKDIICQDINMIMNSSDLIVVSKKEKYFKDACDRFDKPVIDFANLYESVPDLGSYEGLNWVRV